jgi:hypothetical protein
MMAWAGFRRSNSIIRNLFASERNIPTLNLAYIATLATFSQISQLCPGIEGMKVAL